MDLTNEQWEVIEPLIIRPAPRADGKGRPRQDDRALLNGMIWILRTGAFVISLRWTDLLWINRTTIHTHTTKRF